TKTCTITNDDIQPKLHVIKTVINDNGGTATASAFTMSVTGNSPTPGSFPGAASPGTEVAVGDDKTCTITNDDIQPMLHVIKTVINDNGGTATASAFTMSVTGSSPSPASFPGAASPGTTVGVNAGSYSVSETGPSGYASSASANCTGTLSVGDEKTCTITNDDIQPKLIVIKHVIND